MLGARWDGFRSQRHGATPGRARSRVCRSTRGLGGRARRQAMAVGTGAHAPGAQRRGKARDHRRCRCRSRMAAACATLPFLSLPASAAGPGGTLHRVRSMAMPYFRSTISASLASRYAECTSAAAFFSHLHERAAQADRLSRVRAAHCRHAVESIGASSTPRVPFRLSRSCASRPPRRPHARWTAGGPLAIGLHASKGGAQPVRRIAHLCRSARIHASAPSSPTIKM